VNGVENRTLATNQADFCTHFHGQNHRFKASEEGYWKDCDGAVAGARLELRPPVESSDLDEKVLTTTPVRDTSSLIIWVDS
jgi:hypothetical protein